MTISDMIRQLCNKKNISLETFIDGWNNISLVEQKRNDSNKWKICEWSKYL